MRYINDSPNKYRLGMYTQEDSDHGKVEMGDSIYSSMIISYLLHVNTVYIGRLSKVTENKIEFTLTSGDNAYYEVTEDEYLEAIELFKPNN